MHSVLNQRRRLASLGKFKAQISRVLVATDVASRGLDIPTVFILLLFVYFYCLFIIQVDLVINYDIPRDPRDYIHRIGRTGRAGNHGFAISFYNETCSGMATSLIDKLEESEQEIPDFLLKDSKRQPRRRGGKRR